MGKRRHKERVITEGGEKVSRVPTGEVRRLELTKKESRTKGIERMRSYWEMKGKPNGMKGRKTELLEWQQEKRFRGEEEKKFDASATTFAPVETWKKKSCGKSLVMGARDQK